MEHTDPSDKFMSVEEVVTSIKLDEQHDKVRF